MSSRLRAVTCQRCGSGFVLTTNYLDLLARRGVKVVVPALCPTCFLATGPLRKERGKVKWFDSRKHYGFIITEEGKEVFFHEKQVLGDGLDGPKEGQVALFHVGYRVEGPEALNVELTRG